MTKKASFDPRKLMEKAVEVMKASVGEDRSDDAITPKVGAVLWRPDGTTQTALNHLKSFVEHGFLKKEGAGNATQYRISRP